MVMFRNNLLDRMLSARWKPYLIHLVGVLAIVLVIVGAWFTQQFFEERLRNEKGEVLTIILEQTEAALLDWHRDHQRAAMSWAQTYMLRELAMGLIKRPIDEELLKDTLEQDVLRELLSPLVDAGDYQGYFIVSIEKINLASHFGTNLGSISDIPGHILDRAIAGHTVTSLPQKANILLPNLSGEQVLGQPTMFTVAPIENDSGKVIALLVLRIDTVKDFAVTIQQGQLGKSGETYVFNKAGQMLNHSRFTKDLWSLGLVDLNKMSIFNLQIRDPGGNMMVGYRSDTPRLQQPLTLMAKQATQGQDGINLQGYNDYRGVPVIGVWRWNEALGMGITTEIDVEEAYTTLRLSRYLIVVGTSFSILIIIVLNIVFMLARSRVAKSEASLSNAQRIAHLGSWDWDIAHNRLQWSDETYRIFRQKPKEFKVSYETFLNSVHPDDRETVTHTIEDALNNNKPYTIEHRIKCPDGTERIVLEQAIIECDVLGDPAFMHGSVLDITGRKKAEQELTLFKTTSDMIEDCVFMFNPDSLKFFYVNLAALQQLGYTEEELFNMTPLDIKPEFDEESFLALLKPLIKGPGRTLLFQTLHQRKNGSRVPVDIVLQYLAPKDESPRFVAIVRDFSERQRIESQLKTEKEKAEAATRSKSEFLANMSHEIRTPMNGVLGMLELLKTTRLNARQNNYIATATSSAKMLLTVINDILDFSKIESGRLVLENIVFDLYESVEDVAILLAKMAAEKGIEVTCFIRPDVPARLSGDPVRLRQVLTNLISNATKFTQRGEIGVQVSFIGEKEGKTGLRFEVKDTGIGISSVEQGSLFDAFMQADGSITRKFGGTGLGLSISKQLVEMMDGEIGVDSTHGQGSTFWFTAWFDQVEEQSVVTKNGFPADLRVLVIDDNVTNLEIISSYLSNWNLSFAVADGGEQGINLLREAVSESKPFQVLLLDFHMPNMDGLAVTKLIKQDAEISDTKIVLLSSDSDPDDEIRKAGIERYLVKPARQSDIYNVVLQLTGVYVPENNKREGLTGSVFIGAHVLLVDDMSTNQEVGVEMLRELGIEADIASDGQEAIDAVVLHNYDLVLMDCQMPVIDGYAATEIIRAQEQARNSKHVPIIALTAHAMEGDRDACIDAGMDDYLSKPFTLDDLRRILTRWVPQYRQNEAELASEDPDQLPGEKQTDGYKKLETMFDTAALDKLYKLVGEKFSHLVDLFEKDANKILPVLKKAAKDNDTEAVCKSAHALKGVSMNMAAIQIAELCKTLEKQAREEKLTDPLAQIKSISQKLKSAIRALRNLD